MSTGDLFHEQLPNHFLRLLHLSPEWAKYEDLYRSIDTAWFSSNLKSMENLFNTFQPDLAIMGLTSS